MNYSILEDWPNTYSFTKAIAEHVVLINGNDLPISVFRPSISKFTKYLYTFSLKSIFLFRL